MGQKVNPIGFRVRTNRSWTERWFNDKDYAKVFREGYEIRKMVFAKFSKMVVSDVIIERPNNKLSVTLISPKPGIVIAKKGAGVDQLKKSIDKMTGKECSVGIIEVRKPELDSSYVASSVARQLEKRVSFRRAVKKVVQSAMKAGALGIKVVCSGRLGGVEIARSEKMLEGSLPLHTIKADINFSQDVAYTSYGTCGVKVWIYLGDISSYNPANYDKRLSVGYSSSSTKKRS